MEYNREILNLEVSKPERKITEDLFKKCTRAVTNFEKIAIYSKPQKIKKIRLNSEIYIIST